MNKSGDLRGQKDAFHMGKMGQLDGERALEASATVPAGHEYAAGTGGVSGNTARYGGSGGGQSGKPYFSAHDWQPSFSANSSGMMYGELDDEQDSIYTGDGRRRRETNQPAEDNAAAGHEYAAGTGGVTGNYKPRELRETEGAVDIYNNAFDRIEQLTGETELSAIMANIQELTRSSGVLDDDSIWGQAAAILEDAEERTGMSYQDTVDNLNSEKELAKELEREEKYNDLVELTGLLSNTDSINIINNLIENSNSVSKGLIVVDYEMQNQLHNEAEMSIEEAEELYKAYTKYFNTSMDIVSLGRSYVIRKLASFFTHALPEMLDEVFDKDAPIVKEGNYMMYTTNYFEYYGTLNASNKEHDVMVLVEVNEDGTIKESGYVYTFDYLTDTPSSIPTKEATDTVQVQTKYPYFYYEQIGD